MAVITLLEVAVDGVARGLLFALLGAGITLVFGLGNVLNLSLGVFSVIAVVAGIVVLPMVPHTALAAVVGVAAVAGLGLGVDRALLSSVYRSEGEDRILLGIFTTLGLAIFLDGLLYVYYPLGYSLPHGVPSQSVAGVSVRGSTLLVVAVASVVLFALFVFLRKTYLGKATRTVFQDETGALLCGINPRRIRTLIFVLSVVLAGIAGLLWSLQSAVGPGDAFEFTIFGIIVSIVGGVRNIEGTVAAGLLLGLVITFGNYFIGAYVSMVILFAVAVGVLVLRPNEIA
ncbi:branched-chain amino acid ABC transporter permease [Natrononativus amylolyticus]|uniref:branched-chain amino acid ABC transporter permease n=1 Tax=Natrononativus amylolyticus TaxID=2963434 RepID=UPI0020CF0971|nr:branched-chain amino acid ABC transporter permease [Natrononativus amylolyticus]